MISLFKEASALSISTFSLTIFSLATATWNSHATKNTLIEIFSSTLKAMDTFVFDSTGVTFNCINHIILL
jgi:hypothetical protein